MLNNKVTFGLENLHIAFKLTDGPTWDTPIAIPGIVRFAPTPEGQQSKFYADNVAYYVVDSNNGYAAELELALIPDVVLAQMLGWDIDDNGALVEIADGIPTRFALMSQVQGDARNRRFVYYDCQAARPSKEEKTKTESIEPNPDMLPLTIFPIDVDDLEIVKAVMELSDTNATAFNAFFDAVYTPTFTPVS